MIVVHPPPLRYDGAARGVVGKRIHHAKQPGQCLPSSSQLEAATELFKHYLREEAWRDDATGKGERFTSVMSRPHWEPAGLPFPSSRCLRLTGLIDSHTRAIAFTRCPPRNVV